MRPSWYLNDSALLLHSAVIYGLQLYILIQRVKFSSQNSIYIENCHWKKSWAQNDRKSTWLICHSEQRLAFFKVRTNWTFFRDEIFGIFFLGVNPLKKRKFFDDPELWAGRSFQGNSRFVHPKPWNIRPVQIFWPV